MNEFNPDHTFFTSDTHFVHRNIIRLCNRPYESIEEMNAKLIENWNSVVGENDIVFHLGDFALGGSTLWNSILEQLNGQIILIIGNHDRKNVRKSYGNKFLDIRPQMQIELEGRSIYLNHYPFLCYGGTYRDPENAVIQLYGHVHSGPNANGKDIERLKYLFPYQYDVGVDNNNYKPVSWKQIKEIINKQIDNAKNLASC